MSPDESTSFPAVSLIIPVRNERKSIAACLDGVLAQNYPRDRLEVLVADGMSDDGTRAILSDFCARDCRVRVIDNLGRIVSTGLNAAIREARGEVIVRLDAHTEYAPDYVRTSVEVLGATGADNVGGPARTRAETYWEKAIAAAYHSPFSCGGARFHNADYEGWVDTVTYGCWRKTTFDRVGLFDEELVRNQDDEHNLRLTRGGGRVWQSPRIRSWYRLRGSPAALFRQYMQYGYWKVCIIRKHRLPASWRHLVPGVFVALLLLLGLVAPFSVWALGALGGLAALYLSCVLGASLLAGRRAGLGLIPVLPAVFACYHFGYGCGFLSGIWDGVVGRGPRQAFTSLTRTPSRLPEAPQPVVRG